MNNFNKKIDQMVSKILNEEIEKKVQEFSKSIQEGEWKEIVSEKLHGKQTYIAQQAKPKDKITGADFDKLRKKAKKKEMDEFFFSDEEEDNSTPGDYEGDEEAENKAEKLSAQEPTYVGRGLGNNKWDVSRKTKFIGSFDDEHGWFDDIDRKVRPDVMVDYEEEEFPDFDSLMASPYGKIQNWFGPNDGGKFFKLYQDKFGGKPFRIRKMRDLGEEAETEEGNAFSGALAKAKKQGNDTFEVDGKKYHVKEAEKEKWIQKTEMKKGALHKKLNVPEGEKIPVSKLKALKSELTKKAEGKKKLSPPDAKLLKQVNLALTLRNIKEDVNKLSLTEEELIDMIERMVVEQQVKDKAEKENISKKSPEGLKKTVKVQDESKKENDDYAKSVIKKMKEYVKAGSAGEFTEDAKNFPQSNYEINKMKEKTKKYHPSKAVEEYIENFAYPGLENTDYDEIKPNEEWVESNLVGTSKTGNNPEWANAVKTDVGEKVNNKRKKNAYQKEKRKSYNRVTQPVDEAGEGEGEGSLDKMFSQLESVDNKKQTKINEDLVKMKNLITYNRKTQ